MNMENENISRTAASVIYLCSCAVNGKIPDKKRTDEAELDDVFRLARRHSVSAAVASALRSAGLGGAAAENATAHAIRRAVLFDNAFAGIKEKLEEAGIAYMPLKGAILREYYPEYGMREMADRDVLFEPGRAENVRRIMVSLGYSVESFGASNHDVYHKPPVLNFEMHSALFGDAHAEEFRRYYENVFDRLTVKSGREMRFTPEDMYVYMTAHGYKHYANSGTGLRSLLDVYVYLKKEKLDFDYVEKETEKLGISGFEKDIRRLALGLFGENGDVTDDETLSYIVSSGTYGTIEHRVSNDLKKTGRSKLKYMCDRFFVPVSKKDPRYKSMSAAYPAFYRHRILLPALPFYRTFKAMKKGTFKAEAKALKKAETK